MNEELNKSKKLKAIRRKVLFAELGKTFRFELGRWLGYTGFAIFLALTGTIIAKVCYYIALWAWHLF